jgi:hypothetical protein
MMTEQYEIRVKGHLQHDWSDWFDGLEIETLANGETLLTGPLKDQAALHGVLVRIRDLGLPLVSVVRMESDGVARTVRDRDG